MRKIYYYQERLTKCPMCSRSYPAYLIHTCSPDDLKAIITQQSTTIHYLEGRVKSLEDAVYQSNAIILQISKK
ncbi:hypothetical protein ACLIA0_06230 [Bacillaceae bacterium W0354]